MRLFYICLFNLDCNLLYACESLTYIKSETNLLYYRTKRYKTLCYYKFKLFKLTKGMYVKSKRLQIILKNQSKFTVLPASGQIHFSESSPCSHDYFRLGKIWKFIF